MKNERCFTGRLESFSCCHPEFISGSRCYKKQGEMLKHVQHDVFFNYNAFTLIELLVVVLIIGILAAVAVPQYKLAVAKARMTQLVTLSNAVVQAQERYYLANGEYTNDWENLDVGVEGPTEVQLTLHLNKLNSGQPNSVYAMDSRLPGIFLIFAYTYAQRTNWDNVRKCYASNENSQANLLCKNATRNSTNGTANSYNTYIFN